MKSELDQYKELVEDLRAIIEKREEEIETLETRCENLRDQLKEEQEGMGEKLGDSLREALAPFADIMARNGEIHNTPHGKYRWIEEQVERVGCE